MINTQGAVVLGMVYNYLPFMILPIYSVIVKLDHSLIEAARDLGANAFQVFRRVILPLSLPGVLSGITMVFVPSVSTFAISKMLGGGTELLLGDLIAQPFLGGLQSLAGRSHLSGDDGDCGGVHVGDESLR
jgi:spermidine/putrescine transport system permease protein